MIAGLGSSCLVLKAMSGYIAWAALVGGRYIVAACLTASYSIAALCSSAMVLMFCLSPCNLYSGSIFSNMRVYCCSSEYFPCRRIKVCKAMT